MHIEYFIGAYNRLLLVKVSWTLFNHPYFASSVNPFRRLLSDFFSLIILISFLFRFKKFYNQ